MRRGADFFGDTELDLLYMARRLPDALKLEGILDDAQIDYAVETGTYTAGLLIKRDLAGAFFYILSADLAKGKDLLRQNGFRPYSSE